MHAWPIRAAGLFLALSLLSFGFGIASADTAVRVELADFKFTPSAITVPAGDKLRALAGGQQLLHRNAAQLE